MSKRVNDIRKRIAKRREQEEKWGHPNQMMTKFPVKEVQSTEEGYTYSYDDLVEQQGKKIMNNSTFLFRCLLSAVIVLGLAIILKSTSPIASEVRNGLAKVYNNEFQFVALQKWYEDRFGSPIAFLPQIKDKKEANDNNYSVPASGKVLQNFKTDGQGILIQTEPNKKVEAIKDGLVLFVGKKDELGETVIVQHADGSESWYGKLSSTNVKVMERVDSKKVLGTVTPDAEGNYGTYYFAIKMGEKFIDPKKVISFE